jgi:hypothetical protein
MSYPPAGEGMSKCFFTYSSASRNLAEKAKIVKEKVFLEKTSFGKESMRAYKVHSPIRGTYVVDLLPKVIVHEAECETGILLVPAPNKGAVPSSSWPGYYPMSSMEVCPLPRPAKESIKN